MHGLATSVLKEELFGNILVSVLSTEIYTSLVFESLAREGVSNTFSSEVNLFVLTVVDDNVKGVLEFLNFISITDHLDHLGLVGFEDSMALDDLPDTLLQLCKGGVLGFDLRFILDADSLGVVSEDTDVSVVNVGLVYLDDGSDRLSHDVEEHWHGVTLKLDEHANADCLKNLCSQLESDSACRVGLDHTTHDVSFVGTNSL